MIPQIPAPYIFKRYVPEWLKYTAIMLTLIPTLLVFSAASMGVPQAVGYYGVSPSDVQFGTIVFYATVVAYGPVARHFFSRLPAKTYFWISVLGQLASLYGCYSAKNMEFLLLMRVLNAMCNAGINNVCLDLLFRKLKSEHAREIGYACFYTLILGAGGLSSLFGTYAYDGQSMNHFYKFIMFAFLPGTILLTLILNNVRLVPLRLMRISELGWIDCILLEASCLSLGYLLTYGQEYNWLDDSRICWAAALFVLFGLCAFLRFRFMKNPFLDLGVFRSPNFRLGLFLLVLLYLIRGAFNLTPGYFHSVLEAPFLQANELMLYNIAGSLAGGVISTVMIIRKIKIRMVWFAGFSLLLLFYGTMSFRFNINASIYDYVPLLIIQGLGQGMLMNPIIIFYISAAPAALANSAAGFGVMTRFATFTSSIALIDYLQMFMGRLHQESINTGLNAANKQYTDYVRETAAMLKSRGALPDKAAGEATALMHKTLSKEAFIEFAMNYYQWTCVLILFAIFIVLFMPAINRTIINLQQKRPWGAGF